MLQSIQRLKTLVIGWQNFQTCIKYFFFKYYLTFLWIIRLHCQSLNINISYSHQAQVWMRESIPSRSQKTSPKREGSNNIHWQTSEDLNVSLHITKKTWICKSTHKKENMNIFTFLYKMLRKTVITYIITFYTDVTMCVKFKIQLVR